MFTSPVVRQGVITAICSLLAVGCPVLATPDAVADEGLTAARCPQTVTTLTSADIDRVFGIATRRFAPIAAREPGRFPFGAAADAATMGTTNRRGWTSGFFPATTWLLYRANGGDAWLDRARAWTRELTPVAAWTGTHDLGFMVGLPAGLATQFDPAPRQRAEYRRAALTAARSLSTRWNPRVRAFKSGDYDGQWGVIMDSAMNAALLITAGQQRGGVEGAELSRRGAQHLRTLAENFVRPDGSTYHRMVFDPATGAVIGPVAGQGAGLESPWARGQAWAVYGFAQGAALTGDPELLAAAEQTANYWLTTVPDGCIPPWDLSIDDPRALRDSSASAIAANGLLLLAEVTADQTARDRFRTAALTTLATLSGPDWTPDDDAHPGLLQGQTYNVPKMPYEGSYAWGDTYLLQGLQAARALVRS